MKRVLVDTGVIVGFFVAADGAHKACREWFNEYDGELVLPVTVLAETCGMLERWPDIEASFLRSVESGFFTLESIQKGDVLRMRELVTQYADFPLGGIDASVVAVAERLGITDVATLDHRHFRALRPRHMAAFTLVP